MANSVQVENTGQKNMVLTVYELIQGEGTASQGMFGPFIWLAWGC